MKIEYVAIDGKRFDNEEDCVFYERYINSIEMFDRGFEKTCETESAVFIHLKNKDAYDTLLELMEENGDKLSTGLSDEFEWFYWDDSIMAYVGVPNGFIEFILATQINIPSPAPFGRENY